MHSKLEVSARTAKEAGKSDPALASATAPSGIVAQGVSRFSAAARLPRYRAR